jgi:4-carboxymuconolactone decarboxylase
MPLSGIKSSFIILTALAVLSGCSSMMESQQDTMTEAEYNASLPDDVFPDSRGRLPIVNRDDLDDEGKAAYDRYMSPDSTSLAGIQGPGGLRLHANADKSSSRVDGKVRELVRLVIAREMDQQFEWTLHEPVALRQGLSPDTIDAIRYNRSLNGVPDMESAVIQMGREVFREHRVSSETYSRLTRHFGRKDLIQITQLMGGGMNSFFLLYMFDVHLPYDREPLLPID